jgi:hypothetical protein
VTGNYSTIPNQKCSQQSDFPGYIAKRNFVVRGEPMEEKGRQERFIEGMAEVHDIHV